MNGSIFGLTKDLFFMNHALEQAQLAAHRNEVPIGAIVVNARGEIIAQGYNMVETLQTQRAHAEIIALENAAHSVNNWRLTGCWLYVTLEPCSMCVHMARLSRVTGIVFGATSPIFGYHLDNTDGLQVYKKDPTIIIGGVASDKTAEILKQFFKIKRGMQ